MTRVAVIGAGIAGATAARALRQAGAHVCVIDKGRRPGGRAATRETSLGSFDHGAQYFTARDPRLLEAVRGWHARGLVAPWWPRLTSIDVDGWRAPRGNETRWIAVPGMPALSTHLLEGVELHLESEVAAAAAVAGGWQLQLRDGRCLGDFAALLCTLPAPQAAALFPNARQAPTLAALQFLPCWAVMVAFERPLAAAIDAAFINVGPLSWTARNSSKAGRLGSADCWVLHAGAEYTQQRRDQAPERVIAELLDAWAQTLGHDPPPVLAAQAHRWRYALAPAPLHVGALWDAEAQLGFGGDWCHGSRVEGAYLSGLALARCILGH